MSYNKSGGTVKSVVYVEQSHMQGGGGAYSSSACRPSNWESTFVSYGTIIQRGSRKCKCFLTKNCRSAFCRPQVTKEEI